MRKLILVLSLLLFSSSAFAQTREQWIDLGTRIHGSFGALIPIGIRIGLDARQRLQAGPRDLDVVFYSGSKAPCPCIADGVMIATGASPGQGTLRIAPSYAAEGTFALIVFEHRKSGSIIRYRVADSWWPKITEWNQYLDPSARYDAVMNAEGLFQAGVR